MQIGQEVIFMQDNRWIPVSMFLGVIFVTLSVIVAGYIHGNMDVTKVYHFIKG